MSVTLRLHNDPYLRVIFGNTMHQEQIMTVRLCSTTGAENCMQVRIHSGAAGHRPLTGHRDLGYSQEDE
jgi:hypothetical protein